MALYDLWMACETSRTRRLQVFWCLEGHVDDPVTSYAHRAVNAL